MQDAIQFETSMFFELFAFTKTRADEKAPARVLGALSLAGVLIPACLSVLSCRQDQDTPLQKLTDSNPSVVWETTVVSVDTNGDGAVDAAYLGRANGRVYVGVVLGGSATVSIVDFAISRSLQDAICAEPATLTVEALDYPIDEIGPLEGFSATNAMGLQLSGGECDSIHLYWNNDRQQLSWWRL